MVNRAKNYSPDDSFWEEVARHGSFLLCFSISFSGYCLACASPKRIRFRCVSVAFLLTCRAARMQKRAISCTYGGAARPMKLDVLYCTDYQSRNRPVRPRAIGFVREVAPAD
jgi:hypothetical protein